MQIEIEIAQSKNQFAIARQIFEKFAEFLAVDLEFQEFSQELEQIESMYAEPKGCLILARADNEYVGGVGLREFDLNFWVLLK